jgi:hypothetical protein
VLVEVVGEVAGFAGVGEITRFGDTVVPGVANGFVVWALAGTKRQPLTSKIDQIFGGERIELSTISF